MLMTALKRSAVFCLLSCMVALTASAQHKAEPETLFTVNKRPVSSEEFVYLYRKNHQHKPEQFTTASVAEYLDLFIRYKLKVEEARSRGLDTTARFRQEFGTYRNELLKPYLPDARMIDSLVALTYERLQSEVRAAHILIALAPTASPADTLAAYEKIMALRARALAGEDFGSLAARYSDEPRADETNGDLGYFTAMQMVFPFEQAAYLTPVGSVSAPVRTQYGYHLVKVLDRRPARGEVEVSHIMVRTDGSDGDDVARNKIFDIYDKLKKGMPWDDVCSAYSEDANTRDHGGRLRPFGVRGMSSAPQFQEMAFALNKVGEISDPVKTPFGWHILRLERKISLPSFEDIKPSLTQRVSRDERVNISREALRQKMRLAFGFTENAAVKQRLINLAQAILADSAVAAEWQDATLFKLKDQSYPVKDFLQFVAGHKGAHTPGTDDQKLEALLTEYADAKMLDLMEQKVKRESPEYKWLLKEYYEGILLFDIMEKEVWNKAMQDSAGQLAYYDAHRNDYQAGERMVGTIYSTESEQALAELKRALETNGPGVAELLAQYRIRSDSGAFEKDDRTILSQISWEPGTHLSEYKGIHYLVDITDMLPPGGETFEEARASVISDYQTFLEDSWIRELKRKFGVKVKKRAKKRVFAELVVK